MLTERLRCTAGILPVRLRPLTILEEKNIGPLHKVVHKNTVQLHSVIIVLSLKCSWSHAFEQDYAETH